MIKKFQRKIRKVKPFDPVEFIKMAKELRDAVRREEKKYGPVMPAS